MTALGEARADRAAQDGIGGPRQPFGPLSVVEIRRAVAILRRDRELDDSTRFVAVYLQEPAKAAVLAGHGVEDLPRVRRLRCC